jgi:hypothetical protein
MKTFREALKEQRWDDHRYYHHSRINQSLHFISAMSFVCSYVLLFINPAAAALVGWLIAMISRQSGHFFFEPKGYDQVNHATHEHKEEIKVGYNLHRKVVLMALWAAVPVVLWFSPTAFGWLEPATSMGDFIAHVGQVWLALGVGGLIFRTIHLFIIKDIQTGLVWFTKILTDPFHDIKLYHKAPLHLIKGELIDPMHDVLETRDDGDAQEVAA